MDPLIKFTNGWGLSTPSTNFGLAAHGVTLDTSVRSIQYCNLETGKSHVICR